MARNQDSESGSSVKNYSWSIRLLTLAAAGILFLTMYPFEMGHAKWHGHRPVLLLGHGGKSGGAVDIALNILLFIPFGFGLGSKLLRSKSWKTALVYTTLAGTLFSYGIELAQLYIPARDSGWNDVVTNTAGSLLGFLIASLIASRLFGMFSGWQRNLQVWLAPRRLLCVLLVYFAIWFAGSALLEREVGLGNWRTDCFLTFQNDATGRHPWGGKLLQVQIWNRGLSNSTAETLTSTAQAGSAGDPLVNIDFARNTAAQEPVSQAHPLSSSSDEDAGYPSHLEAMAGASSAPADNLVNSIKQANQFSIRAVLDPAIWPRTDGRIISLSEATGISDFYVNQEADSLVFWFRTPLTARHRALSWKISKALRTDGTRVVLFSYDGSAISCYIDGTRIESHPWGAGTALASHFRRYLKQAELKGYRDIYYALVFFPAGALLGIFPARFARQAGVFASLVLTMLIAPVFLEWVLIVVSKGPFSGGNVALSVIPAVLGLLWMKADAGSEALGDRQALPRQTPVSS